MAEPPTDAPAALPSPAATSPAATSEALPDPGHRGLRVDRAGPDRYTGHNGRAAPIPIGLAGTDGCYSPTELLRIAVGGCAGLSAEHPITRRLGADAEVRITVAPGEDRAERRFTALASTLTLDLSGLDPQAQEQLRTVVTRAVHRYCTVGRTVEHGAPVPLTVRGAR